MNSKPKKMKNLFSHKALFLLLFSTLLVTSCNSDDDSPASSNTSKKVVFKAVASSDANVGMVVYGYDTSLTTASSLSGTTWNSSEIVVPANAYIASIVMNGVGTSTSSTLKVQIYVDGVLKKEATSTGKALSSTAQYNLQ